MVIIPVCTQCGGTERPLIRYADGGVRCQKHLIKVALAAEVAVK